MITCKTSRFILFIVALMAIAPASNAQSRCTLTGTIIDRNSTSLILTKKTEDVRHGGQLIPIKNGHFEYTFDFNVTEAYELTFQDELENGAWRPVTFFAYNGNIEMILHPMDKWEENLINGGELNKEYTEYLKNNDAKFKPLREQLEKKRKVLQDQNAYYSPAYDSIRNAFLREKSKEGQAPLYRKRDSLIKTGNDLTTQGKIIRSEFDSLDANILDDRYAFIKSHPDLAGYFLIQDDVLYRKNQPGMIDNIQKVYPVFAAKFPYHPYTAFVGNAMRGFLKLIPGGSYINFTAPDLKGKAYQISDLVKGRVTLLDFWGSWCGSCIANSKLMMPVYQDFRQKGFQVIGIAREYKNTDGLNTALKRDKYPWLNLLELDDKNAIWNKYAISNSGGMMILLDKTGEILAINPSPEQVRQYLTKLL